MRIVRNLALGVAVTMLPLTAGAETRPQVVTLSDINPTETYRILTSAGSARPGVTFLVRGPLQPGVNVYYVDATTFQVLAKQVLDVPGAYTHAVGIKNTFDSYDTIFVLAIGPFGEAELWMWDGESPGYVVVGAPIASGAGSFSPANTVLQAAFTNNAMFNGTDLDLVGVVGRNVIAAWGDEGGAPFSLPPTLLSFPGIQDIHSIDGGDLNGDGKTDLVAIDRNVGRGYVLMNTSTILAPSFVLTAVLDFGVTSLELSGLRVGDIDGDGDPDVLGLRRGAYNDVAVATNSSGTLAAPTTLVALGYAPVALALGDNQPVDGNLDLVVTVELGTPGGDHALLEYTNSGAPVPTMSLAAAYWGQGDAMAGGHVSWSALEFAATLNPAGEATVFTMSNGCGNASDNFVLGPGAGSSNPPQVRIYQSTGVEVSTAAFLAYGSTGYGVNVAAGNLDGTPTLRGSRDEIVTGPGPGAVYGPQVRAWRRSSTAPMTTIPLGKVNFYAYGTLKFGVNVGAADLDGDGMDELLTGAGPGAVFGPHVRAFNFDGVAVASMGKVNFFAYSTLKYGVNVGSGSIDADPFEEILAGPGPSPAFAGQIRGFNYDGSTLSGIAKVNFVAFAPSAYGAKVAAGDVDGDGVAEIGASRGAGPSQSNEYAGFNYDGTVVGGLSGFSVTPGPAQFGGSIGLADVMGAQGDPTEELLAGGGPDPSADTTVRVFTYDGSSLSPESSMVGFAGLAFGVNVVGGGLAL